MPHPKRSSPEAGETIPLAEVEQALARELAALEAVERGAPPWFAVWTVSRASVVVGRGVDAASEVDERFCAREGIAVVRRMSGGRSVYIGPGTLQYGYALPYSLAPELESISGAKRFCNARTLRALRQVLGDEHARIEDEISGDLVVAGRKVAGLALRRRRNGVLVHGTILCDADIAAIGRALRHPVREPAYRAGRSHEQFLANVGAVDARAFERAVHEALADGDV